MTTVRELRKIAIHILEQMEDWDDEDEILTRSSTYGTSGYTIETDDGFIEYRDIELDPDDEEEEE